MSYYDFMMIHYWIPVPKGLWYKYNGEELRIPDNGLFDLLTGDFKTTFRANNPDDIALIPDTGASARWQGGAVGDGEAFIYLRNQDINKADAYNFFTGWEYEVANVNFIKRVINATESY